MKWQWLYIISLLSISTYAKYQYSTVPECDQQQDCLSITESSSDNGETYLICLRFTSDCVQDDTIDKAFSKGGISKSDWTPHYPLCQIVNCGENAYFGIKDGYGCRSTNALDGLTISGIDEISCDYAGGDYSYGADECTWIIPATDCVTQRLYYIYYYMIFANYIFILYISTKQKK